MPFTETDLSIHFMVLAFSIPILLMAGFLTGGEKTTLDPPS
jgi:hypothetical protein